MAVVLPLEVARQPEWRVRPQLWQARRADLAYCYYSGLAAKPELASTSRPRRRSKCASIALPIARFEIFSGRDPVVVELHA